MSLTLTEIIQKNTKKVAAAVLAGVALFGAGCNYCRNHNDIYNLRETGKNVPLSTPLYENKPARAHLHFYVSNEEVSK